MKLPNVYLTAFISGLLALVFFTHSPIGCTPVQLGQADALVGGHPLVATTQPTTQLYLHVISDASTEAAPVVALAAPAPWGWIAAGVLTILGSVAGVYATNKSTSLNQ